MPEDRMIMLYTSGTTGTPNGVELTNKNILSIRSNKLYEKK